jgi:hypothetical protein
MPHWESHLTGSYWQASYVTLGEETSGEDSGAMATTDHPLKRLVSTFIADFAAWILNSPVRETHPLNVELPADSLVTDQVFRVTLGDGRELVLHIEFQGRRSSQPMPWPMLEYMQRLAGTYRLPM